jgi:hypothetical protein
MAATANACIVSREQGPVWDMEPGRPTTFKLVSGQTGGSVSVFEESCPPALEHLCIFTTQAMKSYTL